MAVERQAQPEAPERKAEPQAAEGAPQLELGGLAPGSFRAPPPTPPPDPSARALRQNRALHLQRTLGNQAMQARLRDARSVTRPPVAAPQPAAAPIVPAPQLPVALPQQGPVAQRRLKVPGQDVPFAGQSGHLADAMLDLIGPFFVPGGVQPMPPVQRSCDDCEEAPVQRTLDPSLVAGGEAPSASIARQAATPMLAEGVCPVCGRRGRGTCPDCGAQFAPATAQRAVDDDDREWPAGDLAAPAASGAGAIQRLGLDDVAALGTGGFATLVEQFSPGLAQLIRSGPLAVLIERIKSGVQGWLRGLLGNFDLAGLFGQLQGGLSGVFATLQGVFSGDPAACASFASTIGALRDLGQAIVENPVVQQIVGAFGQVKAAFQRITDLVLAPAFDALMGIAGGIFDGVRAFASTIAGWGREIRDVLGAAWTWVKDQLGLGGDDEDGIFEWLKAQASEAWTQIKESLAPIMGPLRTVGTVLLIFSPVGPTYLLVRYLPPLVEAAQWLWAHKDDPDIVRSAHREMGGTILPQLLSGVQGFGQSLREVVSQLLAQASQLGQGVLELLGAISGIPLLEGARGMVQAVSDGVQRLVAWAEGGLQSAADGVVELFQRIQAKIQPYIGVLTSIGMAIVNPTAIPVILTGWAWQALDDCYKAPIIDFLLDLAIGFLEALPSLAMLGPLWPMLKTGVIGFLQGLRARPPEVKVAVANKLARIISGASPAFILGYVKGLLKGIWEGLTDPFVLIYTIVKGFHDLANWLEGAASEALGGQPVPGAQPAPSPALAGAGAGAEGGEALPAQGELGARLMAMGGELRPPAEQVAGGFMPAIEELFSGGEGLTYEGLMQRLGAASAAIEGVIRSQAGMLAERVCDFFMQDSAEGELGEGVGWLTGTIAFEVVLGIISAGTYQALKPLQGIAKFLDWTGEAMGAAFRALGRLGGLLLEGLQGLRRLFDNAGGAMRVILDALGEIGEKLMRFGDELLGRFGRGVTSEAAETVGERGGREALEEAAEAVGERGGREALEEAGERGGREALEEAGERGSREAGEAAGERGGREAADEAGERGGREAGEEGGSRADEAAEAAERPRAIAEARLLAEANDIAGSSLPTVMGLLMGMRAQYRWIRGFDAERQGGNSYRIIMRANDPVDEHFTPGEGGASADEELETATDRGGREVLEEFDEVQGRYGRTEVEPDEPQFGADDLDEAGRMPELESGYDPTWAPEGRHRFPGRNRGEWVQGAPGDGRWQPHDPGAYGLEPGQSVPFREGVPDFTEYAVDTPLGHPGTFEVPGMTGDHQADYQAAIEALADQEGMTTHEVQEWLRENRLHLHHFSGNEMQIVPERLHGAVAHQGSAVELRD